MSVAPWFVMGGAAIVGYAYLGYAMIIGLIARLRPRPLRNEEDPRQSSVSVLLAVKNAETLLPRRLEELQQRLSEALVHGVIADYEMLVVSDGSEDETEAIAKDYAKRSEGKIQVLVQSPGRGKAAAISMAAEQAQSPFLMLTDVRQRFDDDTVGELLAPFRDSNVGGVSGELVLESAPGVLAGVGVYWKIEKWIRRSESISGSQVGVTGAIAAARREAFVPIPEGMILDDVYWPMEMAMSGYRVVNAPLAKAYDQLPETTEHEFRRKVRTLAGNLQMVAARPRLLVPIRNPLWWRYVSHKLVRLACPWAMMLMIVSGFISGGMWTWLSVLMIALALLGWFSLKTGIGASNRWVAIVASFALLNAAAGVAGISWALGRSDRLWR